MRMSRSKWYLSRAPVNYLGEDFPNESLVVLPRTRERCVQSASYAIAATPLNTPPPLSDCSFYMSTIVLAAIVSIISKT